MLVLYIWPFLKKEWLIISVLKDDSWLSLEVYIELVKKWVMLAIWAFLLLIAMSACLHWVDEWILLLMLVSINKIFNIGFKLFYLFTYPWKTYSLFLIGIRYY